MITLPYSTPLELSIGGVIKEECEHFLVDEIPLYEPEGLGQHIYLLIRKTNLNTTDIVKSLCELFKITDKDIGYAGLKDKRAITTQWFSLSLGATADIAEVCKKISSSLENVEILKSSKHLNKLKTGHLIANRFTVTISNTTKDSFQNAEKILELINQNGLPNFYGEQRFGSKGDNADIGREVLTGKKKVKKHWLKKMYISAYQSELFNSWLTSRISDNLFNELIPGDLLQKSEGGRSFPFDTNKDHLQEFKRGEISYTGPIFGSKVTGPTLQAAEREELIFSKDEVTLEDLKKMKVQGTRRSAKVFPQSIEIEKEDQNIILSFTLPAGSYATILLREFTKSLS
ncbi:tRNA pseudouridine(13) synthase TruD [Halobacteriovorax sp. JY17]|uniref:tRNA pseudouridine(13) synthase TruD n=1 Tax=Halobacteriovorax sp. JY17 TaxID=2014617 RepID=UPI000C674C0E|nr:tRNA pseudouridine(13) synthase TruD [Halobacteriovorax sp. JY17]PIK15228.1 MAG: tRNA pseudouridine synthase D [Halobacteriovorax sp. JY17]